MYDTYDGNKFVFLDTSITSMGLGWRDFNINFEKNIFKEYQFLDYSKYKIGRIKVLEELGASKNKIE